MPGRLIGLRDRLTEAMGGPARRRVVLLLAAVLSLESADAGTVGALAAQLERAFQIGNTELGLLITVSSLVGALASLPMGVVTDRSKRVRVLTITVGLWAAGMVASGLATSYLMLLLTRLALGITIAAAGPMVASLTGDLFPAKERSRVYGMILTGQLVGGGVGLIFSADIGTFAGWRAPFFILALPSVVLAYSLYRLLPEPARGGQSWLRIGDEEIKPAEESEPVDGEPVGGVPPGPGAATAATAGAAGAAGAVPVEDSEVRRRARERKDIEPRPGLVLTQDPTRMSPWAAAHYILRIPSNLVLIGASVLGYFFLAGLRSFVVLFAESHFQLSAGEVSLILVPVGLGAALGSLGGGRLTDRLVSRGTTDARLLVGGVAFIGAAVVFLPAFASSALLVALPFYVIAAALLTAPEPALDAARLDVVPSRLWGRGEGVRTFAQSTLQAFAPLIFGYVSSLLGGPRANLGSGVNAGVQQIPAATGRGLDYTFMIMLVPLLAAGALLLFSRAAYLRDVATADLSELAAGPAPSSNGAPGAKTSRQSPSPPGARPGQGRSASS